MRDIIISYKLGITMSHKTKKIISHIVLVLAVLMGVLVIMQAIFIKEFSHELLGTTLCLVSAFTLVRLFGQEKNQRLISYDIAISIIGMSIGVVCAFTSKKALQISDVLIYWGLYEIIRGAIELNAYSKALSSHKFIVIIELILSFMKIIFGILLCIELEKGVRIHLSFLGFLLIMQPVIHILDYYLCKRYEIKHPEEEITYDPNQEN